MSGHFEAQDLQVVRLAGELGAEVRGLQLAQAGEAEVEVIRALLLEHLVLFFPDQTMDVSEHVEFGRQFGALAGHPNLTNPFTEHPELFELAATRGGVADEWHTDITFEQEPAVMSILHMVRCPEVGGDTMWTSGYAAYDGLSEPMKSFCCGVTALHDALPHKRADKMAVHPVVRVHPETGRRALYVNEHFTRRIVELSAPESEALLQFLTRWVTSPRFTVRYRWSAGTVAMWDNRCTQHFVLNDFEGERIIQRVTVVGDRPEGLPECGAWEPWVRADRLTAASRHDRQLFEYLKSVGRV